MEEVPHHNEHVTLPTDVEFNDMTPCQCLTTTGDLFFGALAKIKELNSIKVINYMVQKISHHIIQRHLMEASTTVTSDSPPQLKPTSSRILWINLLQGFSSSLHPSDLTPHTFSLLTLVDILENVQKCLLGKHDRKTFRLLVQLFISVSQFPELQEDIENQQIIFDLQQEANTQELICQHRSRGNRSGNVERLCEAHPLPEFCERIKVFVSSLIREKGSNLEAKILDGEHSEISEPQGQQDQEQVEGVFEVNDDPEEDEESATEGEDDSEEEQMNLSMEQTPEPFDESGHDPIHVEPFQPPPQESEQDVEVESSMSSESEGTSHKNHRKRKKWSATEESNLIKGVKQFGLGNWTEILKTYKFQDRTRKSLHNKWKQMEKEISEPQDEQEQVEEGVSEGEGEDDSEEEQMNLSMEQTPEPFDESGHDPIHVEPFQPSPQEPEQDVDDESSMSSESERGNSAHKNQQIDNKEWRTLHKFSATEESNLTKGVERFGIGKWTKILNTYKFDNRSSTDLRQKWFQMTERKVTSPRRSCSPQKSYCDKSRQQRSGYSQKKFSLAEENNLIKGVKRFGAGNWTKILHNYKFQDRNRQDLQQKWMIMKRNKATVTTSSSRPWPRPHRPSRKWSPTEEKNLRKGVERFGLANWTKIVKTYEFQDRSRTDLQKKWQHLEKKRAAASSCESTSKPCRKQRRWSPTEVSKLRKGVKQFGLGNWTMILNTYKFQHRTIAGLQNKWQKIMETERAQSTSAVQD